MKRQPRELISILILFLYLPVHLLALPQDLEIFTDFESVSGEGTIYIGQEPNVVTLIGFTVETLDDPALLHSGTKALTLGPGQEGKIISPRGIHTLEFYAAESTGGGKIEVKGDKNSEGEAAGGFGEVISVIGDFGEVTGLPANISPGANPALQSFIADSGNFLDGTDLEFIEGIKEVKIFNVTGKLSIDDLGYTPTDKPVNNTVYTRFESDEGFGVGDGRLEPFSIGVSPNTATFTSTGGTGGGIRASGGGPSSAQIAEASGPSNHSFNQSFIVEAGGGEFTITFETPAYEVDFYANCQPIRDQTDIDCTVEVFDTNDNLLVTVTNLESTVDPLYKPAFLTFNADELGAPGGIGKIVYSDEEDVNANIYTRNGIDDFGFTPIGAPGTGSTATPTTPAVPAPEITTQPVSQSVATGHPVTLSVEASGDDLTYQWYGGIHPDTNWPVEGATESTMTTGGLGASTNFWVQVTNDGGTADSDTAAVTVTVPLVLTGSGSIAGEDIQHPNGNIFDQVLLTGESIKLQAKTGHITRVSFMDEDEDIVQVEYSGAGTFTVTLDSSTYLAAKAPPRYNQSGVAYVTGKPSVVIEGADETTYFSIFTVGKINAVNQALFPEGQEYGAQADVTLVQVINSTGMGGMQLSNAVFSGSTGKIGVDARGIPIAVRLTVGDIDASGDAVPHLLFGSGSFTVAAGNPGLRITGGNLLQTNGASIVVAESGSTTRGFDRLITQNNFKSDNTPQPTRSINATFANEDGDDITIEVDEVTIE